MIFSDAFCDLLGERGYTYCFFVAGGNIMHLLNSSRTRFVCIPVINEVSAVIAAEYFNESQQHNKAFALVTAGPGLTNSVTGIAGSWLESRGVLVIGGQVKSSDLKSVGLRQKGIQEIDGVRIVESITKRSLRVDDRKKLVDAIRAVDSIYSGRPGPVFLEICIDTQVKELENFNPASIVIESQQNEQSFVKKLNEVLELLQKAQRPILLIGGGVSRKFEENFPNWYRKFPLPIMTTWNGADRVSSNHELYWGRPNTWGMRYSNLLIQQCDLLIAVGARLGLQQTGFAWEEFAPLAKIVQVDIDKNELEKEQPKVEISIECDADLWLETFLKASKPLRLPNLLNWQNFGNQLRAELPLSEDVNTTEPGTISPYEFFQDISKLTSASDILVPCSSGGAFTTFMQSYLQSEKQIIISNKGLASMGYGLAGAIGAALANPTRRVLLFEGDGGFAQNLPEIGTVVAQKLNLKIFIFDNSGYASIRMTQSNYFGGAYVGCDRQTGLGLPIWEKIFVSYGIPTHVIREVEHLKNRLSSNNTGPEVFIVKISPQQTYFPKIQSRILEDGEMKSNPLHLMSPELDVARYVEFYRYRKGEVSEQE